MAEGDDQKMADHILAIWLLTGYRHDERGGSQAKALSHDNELQARAALARHVRRHMRGSVGELLALAIAPHMPSDRPGMRPARKIRFLNPAQGPASTGIRDLMVVNYIREHRWKQRMDPDRKSVLQKAAIHDAAKQFRLGRTQIEIIWKRRLERWAGSPGQ